MQNNDEKRSEKREIWSWGAGTDGQLGTARLEDEHLPQLLHLPLLATGGPISQLSCGGAHVIALTSGGKVLTWGRASSGQLGHGDLRNSLHPKYVMALESHTITQVSAGWSHTGFVSDEGNLYTCGDGSFGQLGHGDYASQSLPIKVSFFDHKHIDQIACGQVYAFGAGKRGQLGISKQIKSVNLPEATCGLEDFEIVNITANGDHSAALSAQGHLYTWGRGFGNTGDAYSPHRLQSSLQFTRVALGWKHGLLLSGDCEVYMLGGNYHGRLGDLGQTSITPNIHDDSSTTSLESVPGLDGVKVVDIATGAEHSALVTEHGVIKTWGWGEHGQLGLGNTSDQTAPQTVSLQRKDQKEAGTFNVLCGSGFTIVVWTPKTQSSN